ncbi:CPBP family intramembrane glutamic endopeptidase [Oceanicaulis sp. UBA6590]|uniref:CPBP family intramembrane glutamic endopeptidase n=1 Tax=Oceanicaulis sp. UBA6590 TaxID=1947008 RepID=UPI0025EB2316|nr:CPBP family intramembrane glutamic endopeptidase [Oceanicaulis sp. UBA6590]
MHQDVTQPLWRFRDGIVVLATAMAAYTALSWAHMALVSETVGMEAYLGSGDRLPLKILVISQLSKAVALLGVLWGLGLLLKGLDWRAVGLRPVGTGWLLTGAAAGLGFTVTGLMLVKALTGLIPSWAMMTRAPFDFGPSASPGMIAAFVGMTLVVTPFAEEVFFRGFVYKWMKGHRPVWLAALVSSIIFGASHIVPHQAINAAVMGLVLIWLYEQSGSIWPAILAHAVNNALGVGLGALAAQGLLPAFLTAPG